MKRTFLALVLLMLSVSAFAQSIPSLMNFQGRLAKPDGTAVSDGLYAAVFSIYDAPTGGNLLWSQVFTGVKTHYGVFTIALGDMTGGQGAIAPSGPLNESLLAGNRWLQIQLGGTPGPLLPRQQFLPTAFAFLANTVPDGAITTAKIADGAITAAKLAPGVGGGASGMAGGDLTGMYPNPFLALNVVTSGKIADGAVTISKLADNSIGSVKLLSDFASLNKVSGGAITNTGSLIDIFEPLTVGGLIQSTAGGFKFPDGTVQTTAAQNLSSGLLDTVPSLALIGSVGTGKTSNPLSIAVSGNYAYVLNNLAPGLLKIVDISDPAHPIVKGSATTGNYPQSVAIRGNYAYVVAYGAGTLEIFDVSNPIFPTRIGRIELGDALYAVAVSGVYAYIANRTGKTLQIFDVSNPTTPTLKSSIGTRGDPIAVSVAGNYVYIINDNDSILRIFDVSNSSGPIPAGSVETGSLPVSVTVAGNYAYLVASNNTLQVCDVSDPYSPALISTTQVRAGGSPTSVAASNNCVYITVATNLGGSLQVFDVSNPGNPVATVGVASGDDPTSVAVAGGYVYVGVTGYPGFLGSLKIFGPTTALRVKSNLVVDGTILANGIVSVSDARYKTNVAPLGNTLEDILALRGVSYDWNREKWPANNFPEGRQIGFIAQELERVFPELVHTDAQGYKSVMYQNMTPILVEAVKTLNAKVEAQQKQIEALQAQVKETDILKKQLAEVLARLVQVEAAQKADKTPQK